MREVFRTYPFTPDIKTMVQVNGLRLYSCSNAQRKLNNLINELLS
mgnify:CR=1